MRPIVSLISPLIFVTLIIVGIRRLRSGRSTRAIDSHAVRRFFQYLLLYALIVISAQGLSGLLGRVFEGSPLFIATKTDLALNLAFVVVAVPLFIFLALWTRNRFAKDPSESKSFGWGFYLTITTTTSLAVAMWALHDTFAWAFRMDDFRGYATARLIVWGAIWGMHWKVQRKFANSSTSNVRYLLGSLISLGTVAVGVNQVISGAIQQIWDVGGDPLFIVHAHPILRGAITLLVGAPIWYLYWVRNYSKSDRNPLWYGYVLIIGVSGGLILSVISASTILYSALVWLWGDPGIADSAVHFRNTPTAIGTVAVGLLTWWYHHVILEEGRKKDRTEVERVNEYLMSGIGLFAAAGGLTMVFVAFAEALTSSSVISGSGAINALLAALTLLGVGTPVWWVFWNRLQRAVVAHQTDELASPARRFYLFILFGIGGIVAVVTLLITVFLFFDDIFKGNFGLETIRRMRFALSILLTTGTISGYHWWIYRGERETALLGRVGPRLVILVGAPDAQLIKTIAKLTGGRVEFWERKDAQISNWNHASVMETLKKCEDDAVILLEGSSAISVIPIELG